MLSLHQLVHQCMLLSSFIRNIHFCLAFSRTFLSESALSRPVIVLLPMINMMINAQVVKIREILMLDVLFLGVLGSS